MSQAVKRSKKVAMTKKDFGYWKRLKWLKKVVIIEKDCDNRKRLW